MVKIGRNQEIPQLWDIAYNLVVHVPDRTHSIKTKKIEHTSDDDDDDDNEMIATAGAWSSGSLRSCRS